MRSGTANLYDALLNLVHQKYSWLLQLVRHIQHTLRKNYQYLQLNQLKKPPVLLKWLEVVNLRVVRTLYVCKQLK